MHYPNFPEKSKKDSEFTGENDKSAKAKTIYFSSCRRRGKEHAPIIFVSKNDNITDILETKPIINTRNRSKPLDEKPKLQRSDFPEKVKHISHAIDNDKSLITTLKPSIPLSHNFGEEVEEFKETVKRQDAVANVEHNKYSSRSKSPLLNRGERNRIISRRTYRDDRKTPER